MKSLHMTLSSGPQTYRVLNLTWIQATEAQNHTVFRLRILCRVETEDKSSCRRLDLLQNPFAKVGGQSPALYFFYLSKCPSKVLHC